MTAGYAVEACWEPPTVTPVTDPVADFPTSANQNEAYFVNWVLNNGEPVKYDTKCCGHVGDCSQLYLEIEQWGGIVSDIYQMYGLLDVPSGGWFEQCDPVQDNIKVGLGNRIGKSPMVSW